MFWGVDRSLSFPLRRVPNSLKPPETLSFRQGVDPQLKDQVVLIIAKQKILEFKPVRRVYFSSRGQVASRVKQGSEVHRGLGEVSDSELVCARKELN